MNEDHAVADSITTGLRRHGYDAESVETGTEALRNYDQADLVLLDLELSDVDGLEVCRAIRSEADTPIIVITDSDDRGHRVLGLKAGSDDCLDKRECLEIPLGFHELVARIEAVMRRARPDRRRKRQISRGSLRLDADLREVRVDGRRVTLTRKEFDLLHLLARYPEKIITRRQIMAEVWDDHYVASSRTLDMHVSSLRGKLGAGSWIETARGVGFRLGHG
ncbi:response regulator transcription factor [Actinomadura soli]|uniref:response regulator transcription factor n=1 Tax=Actinomadura soli TaxID=2508997 RepID=UPI00197A9DBF|nr:response regulator transcription factor [Actinomadura soli]